MSNSTNPSSTRTNLARTGSETFRAEAHPSGVRHFLHPSRRPLADARVVDRSHLSRSRCLRGDRAHLRARLHRHAVLRRRHRHSGHLEELARRGGALGHRLAAPRHEPGDHRHVAGDQARRLRTDLCVDLHASVLCGAAVQLARPRHQRADRLQRHRLEPRCRRGELRLRRADGTRAALRAHGGVHRRLPGAVEQRRARRLQVGSRERRRRRSGQGPRHQSCGQVLQGARPAQLHAVAADSAGADPGRQLAARHQGVGLYLRPYLRALAAEGREGQASRAARPGTRRRSAAIPPRSACCGAAD